MSVLLATNMHGRRLPYQGGGLLRSFQGILQPRRQHPGIEPFGVEVAAIFILKDCEVGKSLLARVNFMSASPRSEIFKSSVARVPVSSRVLSTTHRTKKLHVKQHSP